MNHHETEQQDEEFMNHLGMLSDRQKADFHKKNKIPLLDAARKKEFWFANAITASRLLVELYSGYLMLDASQSSDLVLPALLTLFSWTADYFDGKYARQYGVCTNFGYIFDKVITDGIMSAETLAMPYLMGKFL